MPYQRKLFSGTISTLGTGPGTIAWTFNSWATAAGNAQVTLSPGQTSDVIGFYNYSFSIPGGATINGIVQHLQIFGDVGSHAKFASWQMCVGPIVPSASGTDHSPGTFIGTNSTFPIGNTAGNFSDLWGLTWTVSGVNNTNFGGAFSVTNAAASGNVTVTLANQGTYLNVWYNGTGINPDASVIYAAHF